jgi:hypothetical protein
LAANHSKAANWGEVGSRKLAPPSNAIDSRNPRSVGKGVGDNVILTDGAVVGSGVGPAVWSIEGDDVGVRVGMEIGLAVGPAVRPAGGAAV